MQDAQPDENKSTEQPQVPTTPQASNQLPPANSHKGLIIAIVTVAVMLLLGIIAAVIVAMSSANNTAKKMSDSSKQSTGDDAKQRAANTRTASSVADFSAVCQVGAVSNAVEYKAPYRVIALAKDSVRNVWSNVALKYNAPYSVKFSEYASANAVVCLSEQKGAAVKAKTCEFSSKMIDFYATSYTAALYEAKSGKKVKDLGVVAAPAETCPTVTSYDKNDPKIIAQPDSDEVDALVAAAIAQ